MNFYKKIIRNKELRFRILSIFGFVPDRLAVTMQYYIKLKRIPKLKNPERYTEKLQWYKLYYRDPRLAQCVDKYVVREYVRSKGLGSILNELYAVYDTANEIRISELPDKFVLKTTTGSGTNIFCKSKDDLSDCDVHRLVAQFLKQSEAHAGREWAYYRTKPKIIAEKMLEDPSSSGESINDYKFLCFNGTVKCIIVDVDRFSGHKRNFYDTEWNDLHILSDCPSAGREIKCPDNLDKMLEIAAKLSEDFPFVRVDLYNLHGRIFFGELTFYPWSGYVQFMPDSFDYHLGEAFILPK